MSYNNFTEREQTELAAAVGKQYREGTIPMATRTGVLEIKVGGSNDDEFNLRPPLMILVAELVLPDGSREFVWTGLIREDFTVLLGQMLKAYNNESDGLRSMVGFTDQDGKVRYITEVPLVDLRKDEEEEN